MVSLDDGADDDESHSEAVRLGGMEGLEEMLLHRRAQSMARVLHENLDGIGSSRGADRYDAVTLDIGNGIQGVEAEVENDLRQRHRPNYAA